MRILTFCTLLALLPAAAMAVTCGGHGDRGTMLVTPAWLAAHAKDANLVVLAVGPPKQFAEAHIPGSALVLPADMVVTGGALDFELPPMADLAKAFGKLGVNDDSRIVLYATGDWSPSTARAYLTLDAMGLGPRTSILDGGFAAWKAGNQPVTAEISTVKPGKITPCPQSDVIASFDYVRTNLHRAGVDIVDARAPQFYSGEMPSHNRAGHIPGAVNIPYTSVVDEQGKLKPVEALRPQFAAAGVKPGDHIVVYCHIGQQASQIYFVSRYLGYSVQLYDGSWDEWSKHPEMPVETSH